ncbi:MAG TPA: FAD-dependent oxidoreductase, partial [Dehalococcoidales bacterium]
ESTAGIQIRLSTEATANAIRSLKPDVLIIAIGAEPVIPDLPGINKPNVVTVREMLSGKSKTGEKVIIAGAGLTGCEAALDLAQQGKYVTLIDMLPLADIASDAAFLNKLGLLGLMQQKGVQIKTEVTLKAVTESGVGVIDKKGNYSEIPADTVVLSLGVKARPVPLEFEDLAPEFFTVGDCIRASDLFHAVHDGFNVSVEI